MEEDIATFKEEPMTFKEANMKVKHMRKLKLEDGLVPKDITLEEFIERFITQWAIKFPTLHESDGSMQTRAGAWRSLGDITRLCHYYVSNEVTLQEVRNILKTLLKVKKIDTLKCNEIKKRVFFVRSTGSKLKHLDERDEYGWKFDLNKITKVPIKKKPAVKRQAV